MILFSIFSYFSSFCAGTMLVWQIQHFELYPLVGREDLSRVSPHNRAAILTPITAALTLTAVSVALLFHPPKLLSRGAAAACVALNLINLTSIRCRAVLG